MTQFVIDASSVGPLVIPDEAENLLPVVADALDGGDCIVPGHWRYEVGNLGLMAVRRKRATIEVVLENLRDLADFDIAIDPLSSELTWSRTLQLAEQHALTLYDAAYLELAQRQGLTLLSADGRLLKAAIAENLRTNSAP